MKENIQTLDNELFNSIYSNEKFRNEVAFAHGCCDCKGNFKYLKTCSWPVSYIVTEAQKKEALAEYTRAKEEKVNNINSKLVLVGMGMQYPERYEDDVCNHRVRTYFFNNAGVKCFAEFGTGKGDDLRVDFAIINADEDNEQYNYKGLERKTTQPKYTLQNILDIINAEFGCSFSKIEVDNYTLSCNDFICKA